jgi:tripartite-type tricarboxylate transporter receptor subunit TctC
MKKILSKILCAFSFFVVLATPAMAWPTKPLTIVLPSTPGAALDQIARGVQSKLTEALGVPVIIIYKPGADGKIGTKFVVQSDDDHTILLIHGQITVNTLLEPVGDHTLDKLTAVNIVAVSPSIVTTASDSKIKDPKQMLAMVDLLSGAAGGTISEVLIKAANPKWTYIPYKGGVPLFVDLMANHIDIGTNSTMGSYTHITNGKLRPLMVFSKNRLSQLPDVPTSYELGIPLSGEVWFGFMAPANMSPVRINKLSKAIISATKDNAEFTNRLTNQGATVLSLTPGESELYVRQDLLNLTKIYRTTDK